MPEQEKQHTLPPYDLLYGDINLKEVIGDRGLRLLIPRIYLWGRQSDQEYENRKRRQIEEALNSDVDYLRENPVIICAVSSLNQLLLAIIDGHHRNRFAGSPKVNLKIDVMPCIVCGPDVMVEIINSNKPEEQKINQEEFIRQLLRDTANVLSALPLRSKHPQMLSGVTSIDELKTRFESF